MFIKSIITMLLCFFYVPYLMAEENCINNQLIYQIEEQQLIIQPDMIKSVEMKENDISKNKKDLILIYADSGFDLIKVFLNTNIGKTLTISLNHQPILSTRIMATFDTPSGVFTGLSDEEAEKIHDKFNTMKNCHY